MAHNKNRLRRLNSKAELFVDRVSEILSLPGDEVIALLNSEPHQSAWLNPLRGVDVKNPISIFPAVEVSKQQFHDGLAYIQNLSSIMAADSLAVQPGDLVLDMCAAPGGKAARIAASLSNEIELTVNDVDLGRLKKLRGIFNTLGIQATITNHPGQDLPHYLPLASFDRILLDAPCSSEAFLRPAQIETFTHWNLKRVASLSKLQKKLLNAAWTLLAPGGRLIYSTCSFSPEENEEVVNHLVTTHSEAQIVSIDLPNVASRPGLLRWRQTTYDAALVKGKRIMPSENTRMMFICAIEKAEAANYSPTNAPT